MKRDGCWLALFACSCSCLAEVQVQTIHGSYCRATAPPGWTVTAENPAGAAFGADFARQDGAALASFLIMGVATEMQTSPFYQHWYGTPQQAAMTQLTQFGARPMSCTPPVELAPGSGYQTSKCKSPGLEGIIAYKAFAMDDGGYVLLLRTAGAPVGKWDRHGTEAAAVARSVECQVPLMPTRSGADMPTSTGKPRHAPDEPDSGYSQWLGMENYHDASTGQNYWVSPGTDWDNSGPQGAGYYIGAGNDMRKLEPGLAQ